MLIPKQKPKAIITDVDSTLTERTTWYELTERLGASPYEHASLFRKFLEGEISYKQVKKDLFKLWNVNGPIHKDKLIKIFNEIPLRGEAFSLINKLKEDDYTLCLISGSIEMFIAEIAKKFKVNHYYGNSIFHFDLYRINDEAELLDIGMIEILDSNSVCFIEWPEKTLNFIPGTYVEVNIEQKGKIRTIKITS
jgi:HAD superfamily phosphoserine phosphatase-like hydrolase